MDTKKQIKRITRNAIMLALTCIVGMFSIPLGTNIKVSLQLLMVFIIGLTSVSFIDTFIITALYFLGECIYEEKNHSISTYIYYFTFCLQFYNDRKHCIRRRDNDNYNHSEYYGNDDGDNY